MNKAARTEWVAVLQGQNGTSKQVFLSPLSLAKNLAEQTAAGWVVQRVYERERERYSRENYPELYAEPADTAGRIPADAADQRAEREGQDAAAEAERDRKIAAEVAGDAIWKVREALAVAVIHRDGDKFPVNFVVNGAERDALAALLDRASTAALTAAGLIEPSIKACKVCSAPLQRIGVTCGRSECQQADYDAEVARNRGLTVEELRALRVVAATYGRGWKQALRDCWQRSEYGAVNEHAQTLQHLRNRKGTNWLVGFRFPKAGEAR